MSLTGFLFRKKPILYNYHIKCSSCEKELPFGVPFAIITSIVCVDGGFGAKNHEDHRLVCPDCMARKFHRQGDVCPKCNAPLGGLVGLVEQTHGVWMHERCTDCSKVRPSARLQAGILCSGCGDVYEDKLAKCPHCSTKHPR